MEQNKGEKKERRIVKVRRAAVKSSPPADSIETQNLNSDVSANSDTPVVQAKTDVENNIPDTDVKKSPEAEKKITVSEKTKSDKNKFEIVDGVIVKYNGDDEFIVIPSEAVKIGENVFEGNSIIKKVTLHDNVTVIGASAFRNCKSLVSINLPKGLAAIGGWCFRGCEMLKEIEVPDTVLVIDECTFAECFNLQKAIIPYKITEIRAFAFSGCKNLEEIEIPATVRLIGKYAFAGCEKIKTVEIPEGVKQIEEHQFDGCLNLESVTIPQTVKGISVYAFNNCVSLKNVDLPSSVLSVDGFTGCSSLKAIVIPNYATAIGDFSGCVNLESIKIPPTVKSADAVFNNCPKLKNISWTHLNDNIKKFPAYYEDVMISRKSENKCIYCGGDFKLLTKTCKNCGKKKDY